MSSQLLVTTAMVSMINEPEEVDEDCQFFSTNPYPQHIFTTKSIGQIFTEFKNGDIQTHACQRNFVWTPIQKQKFLATISKCGPISGPQFNIDANGISEIMDGQNRIRTIVQFMDDKIRFENENGIKIKYSQMSESDKRNFKNIRVGYTETTGWSSEQCEENFCEIQEGMPLTPGEIINSSTTNQLTIKTKEIYEHFGVFVTDPVKSCGLALKCKRYKHLEVFGTLMDMVMEDKFPQKTGKTALDLYDQFKPGGGGVIDNLVTAKETVIEIMESYKYLVESIDELQKGKCNADGWESAIGESHMLRSVYFLFKSGVYNQDINGEVIIKFKNMIIKTHTLRSGEDQKMWDEIKMWAQNDAEKIYDKYLEFYNEEV